MLHRLFPVLLLAALLVPATTTAQRSFTVAPNDATQTRVYVLDNGLRIYVSPLHTKPRVQVLVHVRVGGKNDPPEATGLAHYLEHMLFKGTDSLGTLNVAAEEPILEKIEDLYEQYRGTVDANARRVLYARIDSLSSVAARYAVPNEYDRLCQTLGVTGTNAFTSEDATVYIGDVPANRLATFLKLEAERFRHPVLRLFHTELEAVYEEKNISLDSDSDLARDTLMRALFPRHPYGTQSILGTVEHLKNPSIRAIQSHLATYYVPNNMAIVIAGDVDPDSAVAWVEQTFGLLPRGQAPPHAVPSPLVELVSGPPVERTVVGPEGESVSIAFRWPPARHRDIPALRMVDMLLSNSSTGLIDVNLGRTQRVIEPGSYQQLMSDVSMHLFAGRPAPGQSLEEVRNLLLEQIEILRSSPIDTVLMQAIVRNLRKSYFESIRNYTGRAYTILESLTLGIPWPRYANSIEELASVRGAEVMDVLERYYSDNYVVVYKRQGPRTIEQSIEKPAITPIELRSDNAASPFATSITSAPFEPIEPRFVDWSSDFEKGALNNGADYVLAHADSDSLVRIGISIPVGYRQAPALPHALAYREFLGTEKRSADDVARAMYNAAMSLSMYAGSNSTWIELSCLRSTLEESIALVAEQLSTCVVDTAAWRRYVENTLRSREDERSNPDAMYRALVQYAQFGEDSPMLADVTSDQLQNTDPSTLVSLVRTLLSTRHTVYVHGTVTASNLQTIMRPLYAGIPTFRAAPARRPIRARVVKENEVLVLNHDMVQALVGFSGAVREKIDTPTEAMLQIANSYLDGGMGSVIFQELREARALAYSAGGGIRRPIDSGGVRYVTANIGTQADKLMDAVDGMRGIFASLVENPALFASAKSGLLAGYQSSRTTGWDALMEYREQQRMGYADNPLPHMYKALLGAGLPDVKRAFDKLMRSRFHSIAIVGSADKINLASLRMYGAVRSVTLNDIFVQ